MTVPVVGGQAFLAYVFVRADGPDAAGGWAYVREVWEACRQVLRMDDPVAALGPATLPVSVADVAVESGLIAACQRPDSSGVWQAFVRRDHDVICLAVMMAPDAGGLDQITQASWPDLERQWDGLRPSAPLSGLLGEALILSGRVAASGPGPAELTAALRSMVREPAVAGWSRRPATDHSPFTLWEASSSDEDLRLARRFVILAPEAAEEDLYRWAWTSGDGRLAPFARYLLHAAKVRYQLRVFDNGRSLAGLHTSVDQAVDDLLRIHLGDGPAIAPLTEVLAARARLVAVQAGTSGLVAAATRLREIGRTLEIASANMALLTGGAGTSTGLFAEDQELVSWAVDRVGDAVVYLDAARERARDVAEITAAVVQQRLAEHQADTQRHQDRMTLLQTSILGALVMALAATQTLGYQLTGVPATARPALVALLAALALALPSWVLRLDPQARHGAPVGVTDHLTIAAVGAAAGWLALAWAAHGHRPAPTAVWTVLAALTGAALTVTATALIAFLRRA